LGKISRHPVYLTLGNIPSNRCNKTDAKVLLGYIPILKAKNNSDKKCLAFRIAQRDVFQQSFAEWLDPLREQYKKGIHLNINGTRQWFVMKIALGIADWPEACKMCLTFGTWNAAHPCHTCLVTSDNMNNMTLSKEDIIIRTMSQTKIAIQENQSKEISVHSTYNVFWDHE